MQKTASSTVQERVRCIDCKHSQHLLLNRNWMGASPRDKYCPVPINGVTLLNGMKTDQALHAWRICPYFEPKEEVFV